MRWTPALLFLACVGNLAATELSDRHELRIELDWNVFDTDSNLGAWPEAGHGKLRYDSRGSEHGSTRLAVDYTGQISPTIFSRVVLDVIDDASTHAGLTEAYFEWRPLPSGMNRHRLRFGAYYPAFSLENSGPAWSSPYSRSFSAINAWIGEEIRPVGVDWRLSRPIGAHGSPHEFGAFAGVFYGNDPAGTLLFWRGWSMHDRQTRLSERLPLPPLVIPGAGGGPDVVVERRLDPIAEIDDRPGIYIGTEWRHSKRAKLSLAFYDNRADPYAFRDGQWAWGTRFWHFSAQVSLPKDVGLIGQRMRGDSDWLVPPSNDGSITPLMRYVTDEFESAFILVSKTIKRRHRVSLRFDEFDLWRPGQLIVDRGEGKTLAYSYELNQRLKLELEWAEIESSRGLWPLLYGQANSENTESAVQLGFKLALFDSTTH